MNKTSAGLIEFMKRKGLTPSGNSKVDVQTCKELEFFPVYKKVIKNEIHGQQSENSKTHFTYNVKA